LTCDGFHPSSINLSAFPINMIEMSCLKRSRMLSTRGALASSRAPRYSKLTILAVSFLRGKPLPEAQSGVEPLEAETTAPEEDTGPTMTETDAGAAEMRVDMWGIGGQK
jgi:hypothetical protein